MRIRNHPEGYGLVTKVLHWLTLVLLVAQVVLGYSIERADDLLAGVADRWFEGRTEGLLVIHAALGVAILVLAVLRLLWRKVAGLPDWAEGLSGTERRIAARTEQILYAMLVLMPLTGLGLGLLSGEDWRIGDDSEWQAPVEWLDDGLLLGLHIATHITLYAALALHIGLVLKHQLGDRDRLLNRML